MLDFDPSSQLVCLACLVYLAVNTTYMCQQLTSRPRASYCKVYRQFQKLLGSSPTLKEQRMWLRKERYKYNIKTLSSLSRSVYKGVSNNLSFIRLLKQSTYQAPIEVSQSDVADYFSTLPSRPTNTRPLSHKYLSYYKQLTEDQASILNMPITVEEVKATLTSMNANATAGAFGLDITTLTWLMEHESTA